MNRALIWLFATPWLFTGACLLVLALLAKSGAVRTPDGAVMPWAIGMTLVAVVSLAAASTIDAGSLARGGLMLALIGNVIAAVFVSMLAGFIVSVWLFGMH